MVEGRATTRDAVIDLAGTVGELTASITGLYIAIGALRKAVADLAHAAGNPPSVHDHLEAASRAAEDSAKAADSAFKGLLEMLKAMGGSDG